jgi:hypothetical protein
MKLALFITLMLVQWLRMREVKRNAEIQLWIKETQERNNRRNEWRN